MLICGIDEAGRGPLIGPMVMCAVKIRKEDEQKLVALGVKDSKLLTAKTREFLYDKIIEIAKGYEIAIVEPHEIDAAVFSQTSNLNWLEATTSAKLLNVLKPDSAILDCPSPNIKAYHDFVNKLLEKKLDMTCAHHADRDFVVVGAASIIAKVTRDAEVEKIRKKIGKDFGSGYLTDPKMKGFAEKYWDKYPEIFRHSWAPYMKLAGLKKQKKLDSY